MITLRLLFFVHNLYVALRHYLPFFQPYSRLVLSPGKCLPNFYFLRPVVEIWADRQTGKANNKFTHRPVERKVAVGVMIDGVSVAVCRLMTSYVLRTTYVREIAVCRQMTREISASWRSISTRRGAAPARSMHHDSFRCIP